MAEQVDLLARGDLGGTMRLGLYEARFEPGSIVEGLYGAPTASERHRHRYEVNNTYRQQIADAGLRFSGISPDRSLVEFIELPTEVHPFYVGTQAHPELRSRPNRPHPLFRGLIGAALERQQASRLFEVSDPGEPAAGEVSAGAVAAGEVAAGVSAEVAADQVAQPAQT